ncbi:MAG: VanZ family protein [Butyrivibrio sp.]|nr:VanZ family protein [Butyrivibrio sp.]
MKRRAAFSAVRLAVFLALSAAAMTAIFVFSAQDGEQSGALSGLASKLLERVLSPVMPQGALFFIIKYIRKIAHAGIYFILGLFTSLSAAELSRKIGRLPLCILTAWLICVLYAVSDELHQSFTAGRTPSFWDVLIDSAGALLSALAVGIISHIGGKRRRSV